MAIWRGAPPMERPAERAGRRSRTLVLPAASDQDRTGRSSEGGLSMTYAVKEMFYSLQGEGRHAGRPAVFCRFAGCNLWSGRERDRATAACTFCDTDFVGVDGEGGGRFHDASALAMAIGRMWGGGRQERFVVLTGGEPLLQVDSGLLEAIHELEFEIAVETN